MPEKLLFESGWEVDGVRDAEKFFRSLHQLLPNPAYLVLEGIAFPRDIRQILQAAAIPPRRHIPAGTIFPTPTAYHVATSESCLAALADLAAKHAEPEICTHLHAYDDTRALLQWYDAFDLSMLLDDSISEDRVRHMCDALGATYNRWQAG